MGLQRTARSVALVIGFGIALQTIYTSYFGVWDPAFHRPLATLACIVAAVLTNPLTLRVAPHQPQQTLAWLIDVLLLAVVAYGISRFIAYSDNAENMLDDFARADQIAALL